MTRVYDCRPSNEDDRPQIDFESAVNGKNDWLAVADVIDGTLPISDLPSVSVQVFHPDATNWDCYMDGGVRGLFSQRFVDAVGMVAFHGLTLLPAKLNGATYYFLRCERPVECFDRCNSVFETFAHAPSRIMDVSHYAFRDDTVPTDACFVLPELPDLLLTESVVERLRAANVKGVRMQPLP